MVGHHGAHTDFTRGSGYTPSWFLAKSRGLQGKRATFDTGEPYRFSADLRCALYIRPDTGQNLIKSFEAVVS